MQAILAMPDSRSGKSGTNRLLFRDIAGVPLLVRAIATARQAGANEVLLIFPGVIPCEIMKGLRENAILSAGPRIEYISVPDFDPGSPL